MKLVRRLLALVVVVMFAFVLGGLSFAHLGIRRERPPMPDIDSVLALSGEPDRPARLTYINTSTQRNPDGGEIVHPVFVLEWHDGRKLLVDTGMDREAAISFGKPAEWVLDADPVVVHRTVDVALGEARNDVIGLVFTHLHSDHTQGIGLLCGSSGEPFDVYMPPAQFERANYTTRMGLAPVEEASCGSRVPIADEGLVRLRGLPGVGIIRAAGHTPGSQLIVAWVGEDEPRGMVLAGDVVFEFEQIESDSPKPWIYRFFITPEADGQLEIVRRYLRRLVLEHGMTVIPSHDHDHIRAIGLPEF